jgi:hypothetical protein
MLRRVALVRTDVSEELIGSSIRVTRIGELGTTLALTSNRRTLRRNTKSLFKKKVKSEDDQMKRESTSMISAAGGRDENIAHIFYWNI